MALSQTVTTPHGLTLRDAYLKISFVRIMAPTDCLVQLSVYPTKADRDADRQVIDQRSSQLDASAISAQGTLIGSLYDAIKLHPEFAGATDS